MEYLVFVLSLWGIYAMQALLLDVLVGEMGLLALCQGVFFGCGAYGVVIVGSYPGSSLPLAAMAGIVISGLLAVTVGAVLSRLGGDDFALATYALALVFHDAVLHWTRATGGALGLVLPEQVWHRGDGLWANFAILAVIASLVGCAVWLSTRWRAAPLGRLVNAIREDETLTRSLGRPVERHRLAAMLATAIGGGVGGVCYALVVGVVDPGGFDPMASILLVAMIVIGGANSNNTRELVATCARFCPAVHHFCQI